MKTNIQELLPHMDSAYDLKQTMEQEHPSAFDRNDGWREEGEWIVLDMLDDHGVFSNVSRVSME